LFFSNRVITEWNTLSKEIIAGNSLSGFKRKPDGHLREMSGDLYKLILALFYLFKHQWQRAEATYMPVKSVQ